MIIGPRQHCHRYLLLLLVIIVLIVIIVIVIIVITMIFFSTQANITQATQARIKTVASSGDFSLSLYSRIRIVFRSFCCEENAPSRACLYCGKPNHI